jgi:NAD+ kinase
MPRMASRYRHVALVGKYQAQGMRDVLLDVAGLLRRQGLAVTLERDTAAATGISTYPALGADELGRVCDLAVVVGGDGTMLGIARQLASHGVPLVGINQGRLGFITDVSIQQFSDALPPIIAGEHVEEHRTMLEGEVLRDDASIFEGFSLNDVVVNRSSTASMLELKIDIGDEFVANFRADGLIIGSPTGSTAYALSAGGPILHPGIAGWVMVPIAPHDLSNRPIVLPDSVEVAIEVVAGRDASVNFDMQGLASLQQGDRVLVRRSAHQVRFLHPLGWSYYATLRRKLHWNSGVTG